MALRPAHRKLCLAHISFKKTCVTAYMYLFKHMLKGTAWFITRQRHWLDWSDQTSSLKKVSGWSVQLIQPTCLCHSLWDLCVWQYSGHQITQEYGRLLLWFIIDERRVFVCSVCDEVHSGRRFHGRDRARSACILLMKVKLSRWGGTKWNIHTKTIRSLCETRGCSKALMDRTCKHEPACRLD